MRVSKLTPRAIAGLRSVLPMKHGVRSDDSAPNQEPLTRRRLLGSLAAGGLIAAAPSSALAQIALLDLNRELRPPIPKLGANRARRSRPTFVKDLSHLIDLDATNQAAEWWNFDSFVTPIDRFFIRNGYPTPRAESDKRVQREHWQLQIHGDAVERELTITYDDLLKMPSRSIFALLECAGNGRSLFWEQQNMLADPQKVTGSGWGLGGVGLAEWRYVPMSHILGLVGLKANAKAALFWSGIDSKEPGQPGDSGRPLPIEMLRKNADTIGLAFKMNGQDLPPDHGAPVRALVPGWCGAASTKWLTEIKIASHDFWVRLNTTQHVMIGPALPVPKSKPGDEFRGTTAADIKGEAVTWSKPRSLLTLPLVLEKQPKYPHNYPLRPGELPRVDEGDRLLNGFAWAPEHGVKHVDVRIDGRSWQPARMSKLVTSKYAWVNYEMPWKATPGRHLIETRVTDNSGAEQPAEVAFNAGGFNFWGIPKFHVLVQ
jgi:sulfane dehydrogenase subunit SoxC